MKYTGLYHTIGIVIDIPEETPITHKLGKHISFYCAKCGAHFHSFYESDLGHGGFATTWRYCSCCGNHIDFGDWYYTKFIFGQILLC